MYVVDYYVFVEVTTMQDYIVQLSNSDSKHCKLFHTTKLFNNYFVIILHLYKLKLEVMEEFKEYRRTKIAKLREVTHAECREFHTSPVTKGFFMRSVLMADGIEISISKEDRKNGSPSAGDMIARNPKNHKDQWLVAKQYANDNFEPIK